MLERTLSIIKPDAIRNRTEGKIVARIEENGFKIIAQKKIILSKKQAELFYREHQGKPFFDGLIEFMTGGALVVQVLEKEDAIRSYRKLMGITDSKLAEKGTLRYEFGTNIRENAVHGSENPESAWREIGFFFSYLELCD